MNTAEEIRRYRLALLEKEFGSQVELANKIGKSPAQISQWKNASKYSGENSKGRRAMSRKTARYIEDRTNKPYGWMDEPIPLPETSEEGPAFLSIIDEIDIPHIQEHDYITLDLLNVKAAAGTGTFISDHIEVLRQVSVSEIWAKKALGVKLEDVRVITAYGDSMRPTFNDNDILFVDEKVREYRGEGVYIIAMPELRAKRLQRLFDGSMRIISDNANLYPPETIKGEDLSHLYICGKVVATWSCNRI